MLEALALGIEGVRGRRYRRLRQLGVQQFHHQGEWAAQAGRQPIIGRAKKVRGRGTGGGGMEGLKEEGGGSGHGEKLSLSGTAVRLIAPLPSL